MSGVQEQPAGHGRSTYGAVVLALAPAGTAPGPADGARPGEDAGPVPIRSGAGALQLRRRADAAALLARLRAEGVLTALVTAHPELPADPPADIVVPAGPPADRTAGAGRPDRHPPAASLLLAARRGPPLAAGAHLVVDSPEDLDIPVRTGPVDPGWGGGSGGEETPRALFNPSTDRWIPDHTRLRRHVGLAIARTVWQYDQATEDTRCLLEQGAELLVEIARFFASLAVHDPQDGRYVIEVHDG